MDWENNNNNKTMQQNAKLVHACFDPWERVRNKQVVLRALEQVGDALDPRDGAL